MIGIHIVADNFFSSNALMDYIGAKGMGMMCTCHRDCFPPELKPFLHHDTNTGQDPRAKVMWFETTIVAIKQCKGDSSKNEKDYTITFVLFQSTGATNIAGVNNLLRERTRRCQTYLGY